MTTAKTTNSAPKKSSKKSNQKNRKQSVANLLIFQVHSLADGAYIKSDETRHGLNTNSAGCAHGAASAASQPRVSGSVVVTAQRGPCCRRHHRLCIASCNASAGCTAGGSRIRAERCDPLDTARGCRGCQRAVKAMLSTLLLLLLALHLIFCTSHPGSHRRRVLRLLGGGCHCLGGCWCGAGV